MKKQIIHTADGSSSIYLPELDEHYHSRHGAIQEAYHVFIRMGLDLFEDKSSVRILEMGFGTGLNCFITFLEARRRELEVQYTGIEAFPLQPDLVRELRHVKQLGAGAFEDAYELLHASPWESVVDIRDDFRLLKREARFEDICYEESFDLVYFDAFGARVQPELWEERIFRSMFLALDREGVLVTYAAKGSVRRAMQSVGFEVERLPGPPGKREMLRARKRGS